MFRLFIPESSLGSWDLPWAIWAPRLWILVAAFVLTLILTPVMRALAHRWKIYDVPSTAIKTHRKPIPYLGGVAIFLGWAIPVLTIAVMQSYNQSPQPPGTAAVIKTVQAELLAEQIAAAQALGDQRKVETLRSETPMVDKPWIDEPAKLFWIVAAGALVMLLGLVDDLKDLSPRKKIIGQVAAALLLVAGGILFRAIPSVQVANVDLLPAGAWWVLAIGVVVQISLVVGATNATNLLDGLDGLCSGVAGFMSLGFLLLATSMLAWDLFENRVHYGNAELVMVMSMALLGSVLGFLPYNFNPASIFMGDAGSMFLGFIAAAFMILFAEQSFAGRWFLGSMVIFGLPIFDTALALVRRLVNHQPIFAGDRSHFYDQLVDRGCSVKQSVLINYVLAAAFMLVGVGMVSLRVRYAVLIHLAIFAAIALFAVKRGMLKMPGARGTKKH